MILPECCPECAAAFAERLRLCVSSESIGTPEGMIPVTISLGVAASSKERMNDADSLVRAAGKAPYRAKDNGRNRVELAVDERMIT